MKSGDQYDDDHSRGGRGGYCDTAYEELVGRDQGGCGDLDVDESVQEGQKGGCYESINGCFGQPDATLGEGGTQQLSHFHHTAEYQWYNRCHC